ncbi:MAG TPA: diaminopimelate epimerase [Candidatus Wujingus californicus]|uniref:diaminopimelate epimerase n=1 Tax=Candidatus Wujingus californicus TaxID=3367618 RepID=UPI001D2903E0|nr:diaminopimelate epimerase [Planctomycetota bacterium]MDO8094733.1 diaminopimelate epimerase [Candidatus Brocadiales bacterium]
MKFTKMHGIGNDYVYVNCFEEEIKEPAKIATIISDRHFGVGSDGLILIMPSKAADCKMRIFNADGSEAQMCGNGIRCVAKYVYDHKITQKNPLTIETPSGIKTIQLFTMNGKVSSARVNMGKPGLMRSEIPMLGKEIQVINEPLTISKEVSFYITCVSMGNPHCVIFIDDFDKVDISKHGAEIERHNSFPERTNVHFVKVHSPKEVTMKTWERGSGITLACGTGASAVCVAGVLNKKTERKILAHLPGGDLELEWAEDGNVYMTGLAAEVFTGEWIL